MSAARDVVLGRVRAALTHAEKVPLDAVPRTYADQRPAVDLVGLFCERVADYRATVQRVPAADLHHAIAVAARDAEARRLLVSEPAWAAALAEEFEVVDESADLDQVDAVVTSAAVGVASTGTIVLDHGPGQGRRAVTLVPDVHVCIVTEEQVADDVPAALTRLDPARPLTFISGPSATSDIELNRVEGVHGPRTLHVLVVGP